MWITLVGLLVDATKATVEAVQSGTAEAEAKALDALDQLLSQAAAHISGLRLAIAQNRAAAEKELHDKFNPEVTPLPDGDPPTKP